MSWTTTGGPQVDLYTLTRQVQAAFDDFNPHLKRMGEDKWLDELMRLVQRTRSLALMARRSWRTRRH